MQMLAVTNIGSLLRQAVANLKLRKGKRKAPAWGMKKALRETQTLRARWLVVRFGHRPPTRTPVTDRNDYNTLRR